MSGRNCLKKPSQTVPTAALPLLRSAKTWGFERHGPPIHSKGWVHGQGHRRNHHGIYLRSKMDTLFPSRLYWFHVQFSCIHECGIWAFEQEVSENGCPIESMVIETAVSLPIINASHHSAITVFRWVSTVSIQRLCDVILILQDDHPNTQYKFTAVYA